MNNDDVQPSKYQVFVESILKKGITGAGPFKGAQIIADEALRHSKNDPEKAIQKIIRTHVTMVSASGFAFGMGGLPAQLVGIPADLTAFYVYATRMVTAIAILRGYDPNSEEVRTAISVSLIGAFGTENLAKMGIQIGNKAAMAALKKVPGKVLSNINKKVGFRLLTKFGEKGVINLGKAIPFVGAGVGASVNGVSLKTISRYAKHNFAPFNEQTFENVGEEYIYVDEDDNIVVAEIIEDESPMKK